MKPRTFLLGALAYLLVTFPLASVWHLVIFKDTYQWLGMYREDPSVPLGFFVILIQGLLLSHVFPSFSLKAVRFGKGSSSGSSWVCFFGAAKWWQRRPSITSPLFRLGWRSRPHTLPFNSRWSDSR